MTAATPRQDVPATLEQLAECTQDAWQTYRDALRDLQGPEYDQAELDAWERLQAELRDLEDLRADLLADAVPPTA